MNFKSHEQFKLGDLVVRRTGVYKHLYKVDMLMCERYIGIKIFGERGAWCKSFSEQSALRYARPEERKARRRIDPEPTGIPCLNEQSVQMNNLFGDMDLKKTMQENHEFQKKFEPMIKNLVTQYLRSKES
mgnify:CR=1 FL=1